MSASIRKIGWPLSPTPLIIIRFIISIKSLLGITLLHLLFLNVIKCSPIGYRLPDFLSFLVFDKFIKNNILFTLKRVPISSLVKIRNVNSLGWFLYGIKIHNAFCLKITPCFIILSSEYAVFSLKSFILFISIL